MQDHFANGLSDNGLSDDGLSNDRLSNDAFLTTIISDDGLEQVIH